MIEIANFKEKKITNKKQVNIHLVIKFNLYYGLRIKNILSMD